MVRVGRKFHRLLFSRLTRLGRKYLLLKIISGWQNFIFDQFHSVRDSGLLCQNVGRCEGNPRQTDCVDFPLQIKSRNEVIKALKARDLLIEKSSRETARLNSIIEEKDQIIFKREQSISIRDKWLEQLSIESQFKDSIIGKNLSEGRCWIDGASAYKTLNRLTSDFFNSLLIAATCLPPYNITLSLP